MLPALRLMAAAKASRTALSSQSARKYSAIAFFTLFSVLFFSSCSREEKFEKNPVFYDFVQNFPLAEVQQEFTFLDIGTPTARRNLGRGWSHDEKFSGQDVTFVWGLGEKSALELFLFEPHDIQLVFRCLPFRFPNSPVQTISIEINGESVGQVTLQPALNEYEVTIPQTSLVSGKNRLEFRYAYARAPKDVRQGATDIRRLAVAWDYIRFGSDEEQARAEPHADVESGVLYIPFGAQVDYYLILPRESVLTFDGLFLTGDPESHLSVVVHREDGEEQVVETLQSSAKFKAVPLPGESDQMARLSFRAVSPKRPSAASGGVILIRPSLRSLHPSERALGESKKPNVIIYLIDALRADHLGCYGYQKPISPNIDAFAKDAILFENAIAQAPWTKPSIASIFTGLGPAAHGVDDGVSALPAEATTLAEILRAAGYYGAAFITNINAGSTFGFDQGFVDFVHLSEGKNKRKYYQSSEQINQKVFAWLENKERQVPFFLYIHTMDTHAPYTPPPSFREKYASAVKNPDIGSTSQLQALVKRKMPVTQTLVNNLVSLYDAEIAFNDHNFGIFLQKLRQRGLYDESLIILLSDHGEEFYEHGSWEHQKTLYAEMLNIPLIIKFPSSSATGKKRIQHMAQHIDILPTILDSVGIQIPQYVEGQSLLALLSPDAKEKSSRRAFSHLKVAHNQGSSVIEHPWKLIRRSGSERREHKLELYDLRQDPSEKVNLVQKYPEVASYLLSLIETHERSGDRRLKPGKVVIDEELRERLKALGYVQ
jgi:arylsulfatase A-like enzyme